MENLDISPTSSTPEIKFNAGSGHLLFQGRSIPEDPGEFYERVLAWLEKYFAQASNETVLEFRLDYANSGSSKYILEMLKDIATYTDGKNVKVIWAYEVDDESIQELGELYEGAIPKLTFEMVEYEDEDEDYLEDA